jgi:hypothetical protein
MGDQDEDWQRKGATLSDKTARQEFRLSQYEIAGAIRAGRLQPTGSAGLRGANSPSSPAYARSSSGPANRSRAAAPADRP